MNKKNAGKNLLKITFYFVVFLVFIAPILRLLIMSLKGTEGYGLSNYALLLKEKRTLKAIGNTIVIAVCSDIIATVAGSLFAFLVAYTNIKKKAFLELLVLMPFIIPSYIITLSWSGLFGNRGVMNQFVTSLGFGKINIYSIGGIILVLGICNIPIVYMSVIHILRKIPVDMEWAARACGYSQWYAMLKINLIQALPAIAGGSVLAFLSAIDNFSVPAFLGISSGIPVLSTYIYEKSISFGPNSFPLAAALSVMLSAIAIGGTMLEGLFVKKSSGMDTIKEDYSVRIHLKKKNRILVEWFCLVLLCLINIVPLISMFASSVQKTYGLKWSMKNFSLENFEFVFHNRGVLLAIRNSIFLAILTCVICILIGTAVAYQKVRKKNPAMKVIEKSASLTYAIPGIVLALSMIFNWVEPIPGIRPGIYGTIHILIIAYITRYLILQIKESTTAVLAINPALEEASLSSGRSRLDTWIHVLIPLLVKPVLAGTFLIFVSALTELTLSSMLAAAGTRTIGLAIFNFQQAGDYNLAAAMSAVIVVLVFSGYLLINMNGFGTKKMEGNKNELKHRRCKSKVWGNPGTEAH